jgi:glucose-6-phosphate isomerase
MVISNKFTLQNADQYQTLFNTAFEEIAEQEIITRIWKQDHTVWKNDPDEITNRLGWLNSANAMLDNISRLEKLSKSVIKDGYTHALLLGMGGSSLAPEVFSKTFGIKNEYLDLSVLDSTDPDAIHLFRDKIDPDHTLFIVSTKSGGTVETLSFFKYFYNWLSDLMNGDDVGKHFIAITDPGSQLDVLADRFNFRDVFLNDSEIGGRFSALSYFGLVPAALTGIDIQKLLTNSLSLCCSHKTCTNIDKNEGALLGAILGELYKQGRDKLTFIISPQISTFGNWVEQLIAESTGKEGNGILPIVTESIGSTGDYGNDRAFVVLQLEGDDSIVSDIDFIKSTGHPIITFKIKDLYDLGSQFFLWEFATAVACNRIKVNPFNQQDVESSKCKARNLVKAYTQNKTLPKGETAVLTKENLADFLTNVQSGAYISLHVYIQPTDQITQLLSDISTQLRNRTKIVTTIGYGPRFLHSTGQLHKGDSGKGLFIQLTSDSINDIPIPDESGLSQSSITFNTLKNAQAMGDYQALKNADRKVIRFHLGNDVIGGLEKLKSLI